VNQVYNIALGERTTLNELFTQIQARVRRNNPTILEQKLCLFVSFAKGTEALFGRYIESPAVARICGRLLNFSMAWNWQLELYQSNV